MKLNLNSLGGGGTKGPAQAALDAGSYPVRIVQLIHTGLQAQRPYDGQEKGPQQEMRITYEFLDEFMLDEDGGEIEDKPRWLSEDIAMHPLTSDRAKSTLRFNAFDSENDSDGNIFGLIGRAANLTIVQNQGRGKNSDKVYNNISGASSMRAKDLKKWEDTPLVNPPLLFSVDEPDMEAFGKLPEFVTDKIKSNLNYNGSALQKLLGGDAEEPEATDDDNLDHEVY